MIDAVAAGTGLVIVAAVGGEVFNDLFHPTNSGALSDWLGRTFFNLFRPHRAWLPLAGPISMVAVIAVWVVLLVVGFALIFYGGVPFGFRTSVMEAPTAAHRMLTAFYFSAQTLTTLAFGDLVAYTPWLQFMATLEGLVGFAVLTASVSSIVLIYPALARQRLLARGVAHVLDAERRTGVALLETKSDLIVADFARDVTNARIDLIHFPIVYYFAAPERQASLAFAAPHLSRFARDGQAAEIPAHVRLACAALDSALDDFARALAPRFLDADPGDRDGVFRAYAHDHRIDAAQA
jgi:hypothetical protein